MELVSIGKFAKMVGVTTTTLRRMHQSGDFISYHITKGGTRYYSMEQLKEFSNAPKTEKLIDEVRKNAESNKNKTTAD